ncbi:MAG: hypothetical protein Q9209_006458 [Squamulea sp. 1 TL-2023]
MPKRKASRTLAEEVADLDDPTPRDLDPEQQEKGNSSEDSSVEGNAQATEHYVKVGKGKLRKPDAPSLGPEYSGLHISRNKLLDTADARDDDPFASGQGGSDGSSDASVGGEYVIPKKIDLDLENEIQQDDEIASDEALGEDDNREFERYISQRSKSAQGNLHRQNKTNGHAEAEEAEDKDSDGFSGMDSGSMDGAQPANSIDGDENYLTGSNQVIEDDENINMGDRSSLSSGDDGSESEVIGSETDGSSTSPPADDDRAALRKIMEDSQKAMTLNLSKAAKSDVAKGHAIKQQRTAFDSLLNTRIRLQKALVATNSMQATDSLPSDNANPAIEAAEKAALRLWSTIDSLRHTLARGNTPNRTVSPIHTLAASATPSSTLWTHMQDHERQMQPQRLSNLNKWSSKTAPASTLPRTNKFSATPSQQTLSTVLEQQLASATNMEKLIAKTQMPRSCAPLQAAAAVSSTKSSSNPDATSPNSDTIPIYDDADFYSLLLRDLLEQRSSDPQLTTSSIPGNGSAAIPGIKDPALRIHKRKVDTKASKGRKIRYNVQEKLQNFMAPDDRSRWGETQRQELFRGLLGMNLARGDNELMSGGQSDEEERAEEGLRLFR